MATHTCRVHLLCPTLIHTDPHWEGDCGLKARLGVPQVGPACSGSLSGSSLETRSLLRLWDTSEVADHVCDRWVMGSGRPGSQRSLVTHQLGLQIRRNHFTPAPARRLAMKAGLLPASLGLSGWTIVPSGGGGGRGFRFLCSGH